MPSLSSESPETTPSPYINRFVQPDTIIPDLSNPQSWNRYSYGLNSPLVYTDPSGHDPLLFLLLVAVAILTAACAPTTPQPTPQIVPTVAGTLPVTGSESRASEWGPELTSSTNCYAYALNLKKDPRDGSNWLNGYKLQPGELSGNYFALNDNDWDWKKIIELTKDDLATLGRTLEPGSRDEPCPKGSYKIALAIDPLNDDNNEHDFHFYRQDANGLFSSKTGIFPVANIDVKGKFIFDPATADPTNRYRKDVRYTEFDGYYCVSAP